MVEYNLYTKKDCPPCAEMKSRLDKLGLTKHIVSYDAGESVHSNSLIAMGFRSVPVLVCVDMGYVDGLPFVLNSIQGRSTGHTDDELTSFFKGADGWMQGRSHE